LEKPGFLSGGRRNRGQMGSNRPQTSPLGSPPPNQVAHRAGPPGQGAGPPGSPPPYSPHSGPPGAPPPGAPPGYSHETVDSHSYGGGLEDFDGSTLQTQNSQLLQYIRKVVGGIGAHLRQAVIGRDSVIDMVCIAMLADGHILLEDHPGSGKTTLAKALGDALTSPESQMPMFKRIQFTPDLLPSDITGVSIFQAKEGSFQFSPGPIFSHIVLADEINRTPPKVQSAMLEAMAEKQVTVDGKCYPLDHLFFVIATQNPLDTTGTYPLPTPQLDRFLFKIKMTYIDPHAELEVLNLKLQAAKQPRAPLEPVSREDLLVCRQLIVRDVQVAVPIRQALVEIAGRIRQDTRVAQGISTRSLVMAVPALQARAAIEGRDYVNAEDLQVLGPYIFCHRMELAPGSPDAELIFREVAREPMERLVQAIVHLQPPPFMPG